MQAIGYLEVAGLPNGIVAADKMLKTAAVSLNGIENTKGSGWVTVIILGDVAAVSVAIEVGKQTIGDAYVGSTVLANPAEGIADLGSDLIFSKQPVTPKKPTAATPTKVTDVKKASVPATPTVVIQPKKKSKQTETETDVTCNLCNDPACPRKLGEPRKKCIHYRELFKK